MQVAGRLRALSLALVAVTLVAASSGVNPAPARAVEEPECPDYMIVGARGNDQEQDEQSGFGDNAIDAAEKLTDSLISVGKTSSLKAVDFDAVAFGAVTKPDGTRGDFKTYFAAIEDSAVDTVRILKNLDEDCGVPTKVIFVGYSQGADVIGAAMENVREPDAASQSRIHDLIKGAVLMGDPGFDPDDVDAGLSSYPPDRAGLMRIRAHWKGLLDGIPVVSACHEWDAFCQGAVVLDTAWFGKIRMRDYFTAISHNKEEDPFEKHAKYAAERTADQAVCELVEHMQIASCGKPVAAPAVDVTILVDTTSAQFSVVSELQERAAEIVSQVSHNGANTRYAVIGYGQDGAHDVTGGFTVNSAEAVSAIKGLQPSSGGYGALFSAIRWPTRSIGVQQLAQ
jgi:hypothetical protein